MIDVSRVHYWHTNSSTGGPGAGWGLWLNGWGGTLDAIKVAGSVGIHQTIIRGPEGDVDGVWPLDFYVPSAASRWIHAGAVRRFVEQAGGNIMPYFGSLPQSPDMREIVEAGDAGGWLWRVMETIKPWLDAGCKSLAFDHVGEHGGPDDPSYWTLRALQRFGLTIFGEPHGDGCVGLDGVVVNDEHWRSAWKKADFREQFKGRVIRITSDLDAVQAILDDGHEAAVTWGVIREMEGTK